MSNVTNTASGNMSSSTTTGQIIDGAINTVSSVVGAASSFISGSPDTDATPVDTNTVSATAAAASNATSTGPTWIDSTFRTADSTLLVFGIVASIFVIAAFRGDHLTPPSMKMASGRLLGVFVVLEAIFVSNFWAYGFKLVPCVFTECLVGAEEPGSAAGVASIFYIVVWSVGFLILIGMKLMGWRGLSIFETDTDELTGMFGGL